MFSYKVEVFKLNNSKSSLVAFANIVIEDVMVVKGFKIFNGKNGLFVKSPSRKSTDKEGKEIWPDEVVFLEPKAEGEFMGAVQKEIFSSIIQEYNSSSSAAPSRQDAAKAHLDKPRETMRSRPSW